MEIYTELARTAADQWGLFTSAQARRLGATAPQISSWAKRSLVAREAHGLYRVVGAPEDLDLDGLRIAWLCTDPAKWRYERKRPAIVSHLSAAHTVRHLGTAAPGKDHLTTHEPRRTRAAAVLLHTDADLADDNWEWIDGLPVTTLPRTVADLYRSGLDGGHLGDIIRDALHQGAAARHLAAALDGPSDGHGRRVLEDALLTCGSPVELAAASDLLNRL